MKDLSQTLILPYATELLQTFQHLYKKNLNLIGPVIGSKNLATCFQNKVVCTDFYTNTNFLLIFLVILLEKSTHQETNTKYFNLIPYKNYIYNTHHKRDCFSFRLTATQNLNRSWNAQNERRSKYT